MYDVLSGCLTPIRVVSSYRLLTSPVGVATKQKNRHSWGIAFKFKGKTVYKQNGNTVLSDASHIMLLPKGAEYEWTCVEPGECILIDFDALEAGFDIGSVEISDPSVVLSAFSKIERSLSTDDPAGRLDAMQQLYGLLSFLLRASNKQYIPKEKSTVLSPAMDYITANYSDPSINNEKLAALCDMSTVYFRKSFRSVYGESPIHYLNHLRINKAKAILSGDYESVGQVAESVGYSSVYHFSKMFKQYTGSSPSDFAKLR